MIREALQVSRYFSRVRFRLCFAKHFYTFYSDTNISVKYYDFFFSFISMYMVKNIKINANNVFKQLKVNNYNFVQFKCILSIEQGGCNQYPIHFTVFNKYLINSSFYFFDNLASSSKNRILSHGIRCTFAKNVYSQRKRLCKSKRDVRRFVYYT